MLVIGRKPVFSDAYRVRGPEGEAMLKRSGSGFWIGRDIFVQILDVSNDTVHVGIRAPRSINIRRDELPEP